MHLRQFRIDETPAQRRILQLHITAEGPLGLAQHKRSAGHALDATSYKRFSHARLNSLCRAIDSLQAGATESIDRLSGHRDRQTGQQ